MGNKKQYRECEECGAPIDSHNPSNRLCKRCEIEFSGKHQRGDAKDQKKRKRKEKNEEFFEAY